MVESSRAGLGLNRNLEINLVSLFVWFNCGLAGSAQTGKFHSHSANSSVYVKFPARASFVKTTLHFCTPPASVYTYRVGSWSLMEDLLLSLFMLPENFPDPQYNFKRMLHENERSEFILISLNRISALPSFFSFFLPFFLSFPFATGVKLIQPPDTFPWVEKVIWEI